MLMLIPVLAIAFAVAIVLALGLAVAITLSTLLAIVLSSLAVALLCSLSPPVTHPHAAHHRALTAHPGAIAAHPGILAAPHRPLATQRCRCPLAIRCCHPLLAVAIALSSLIITTLLLPITPSPLTTCQHHCPLATHH